MTAKRLVLYLFWDVVVVLLAGTSLFFLHGFKKTSKPQVFVSQKEISVSKEDQPKEEQQEEAITSPQPRTVTPPAPSPLAPEKSLPSSPVPLQDTPTIINRLVSVGFGVPTKTRTIDTLVLHSSYDASGQDPYSVEGVLKEWKDAKVAPHYMIDRSGNIYRTVEDKNIAYHAGVAKMPDGRSNVNDFSIGIEMINTLTGKYTDAEYTALNNLIVYLKAKYGIKSVVGHSDIAPGRKTDPWNFDWKKVK